MRMKRKTAACFLAGCVVLSMCRTAFAAPAYLTDSTIEYSLAVMQEKKGDVIGIPREKRTFTYSFAEADILYSDFLFAPQPFSAGIKFSVEGTAAHTLTVQLVEKETGKAVREIKDVYVMKENRSEYIFSDSLSLHFQRGYYIRLLSPSDSRASGTITVEVLEQNAEKMLRTMGIVTGYENGQFIPFRTITRAEMCVLVAKTAGYSEVPPRQVFTDVPPSHWASSYIAFCYEKEFVQGIGEELFAPDTALSGEELITMLVRLLGWTPEAEMRGGYPEGFGIVASKNAITKGISMPSGAPVTRKKAMECLLNSLFVPLMVQSAQDETETYIIMDGKNNLPMDTLYFRLAKAFE